VISGTCGWSRLITRSRVHDSKFHQIVLDSNEAMAIHIILSVLKHAPAFTVGHNVYSFDNTVLAFALPSKHPYTRFFRSVSKSSNNTAPSMGLILDIPGINNLDTLMYIRSSHILRCWYMFSACVHCDWFDRKRDADWKRIYCRRSTWCKKQDIDCI
jgi:hypothetical protein